MNQKIQAIEEFDEFGFNDPTDDLFDDTPNDLDSDECTAEEWINTHGPAVTEWMEVEDEDRPGHFIRMPAINPKYLADADEKSEEEMVRDANNWKVTTGIIIGLMAICGCILWFCFR